MPATLMFIFFFFNDTATTEIYTLSLHDALPILLSAYLGHADPAGTYWYLHAARSEEHTSELQSQSNLVCRLLLEKKKDIEIQFDPEDAILIPRIVVSLSQKTGDVVVEVSIGHAI